MVLALPPGLEDLSDTGSVDLRQTARDAARRYGVNPERFVRQITQESNFNPQARNASSGARGVAQFMPDTAKELGVDPNDPVASLDAAAKYVRRNTDYHGGDERAGFASYDAGPGTIENLKKQYGADWETHLPAETKTYLASIYGDSAPGGADAAWAHPLTAGDSATALQERRIGNRIGVDPQAAAITGQEAILADQQNQGAEPDNLLARLRQSRGQEATSGGFRDTELQTAPNANTDNPLTLLKRVSDTRVPILSPAAEAVQGAVGDVARPLVRTAASAVTGGPLLDAASAVGGENLPVVGNVLKKRRELLNTVGDVGGDLASGFVPTTAGGFAAAALTGDVANAGEAAGRVASAGRGVLERAAVSGLEGEASRAPEAAATVGERLLARGRPELAGGLEGAAMTPEEMAAKLAAQGKSPEEIAAIRQTMAPAGDGATVEASRAADSSYMADQMRYANTSNLPPAPPHVETSQQTLDEGRKALLASVVDEARLRRQGIPTAEIAAGRGQQAAQIKQGVLNGLDAGLSPEEIAQQGAAGARVGGLRKTFADAPSISAEQRAALIDEANRKLFTGDIREFDWLRTVGTQNNPGALTKALAGQGLQPNEIGLLRQVYGDAVAEALMPKGMTLEEALALSNKQHFVVPGDNPAAGQLSLGGQGGQLGIGEARPTGGPLSTPMSQRYAIYDKTSLAEADRLSREWNAYAGGEQMTQAEYDAAKVYGHPAGSGMQWPPTWTSEDIAQYRKLEAGLSSPGFQGTGEARDVAGTGLFPGPLIEAGPADMTGVVRPPEGSSLGTQRLNRGLTEPAGFAGTGEALGPPRGKPPVVGGAQPGFGGDFGNAPGQAESKVHRAYREFVSLVNAPISLVTYGHEPVFRQGIGFALSHPSTARSAVADMATVARSPEAAALVNARLNSGQYVRAAIDAGWLHEGDRPAETFVNKVLNAIPGMKNSRESARIYLTSLRKAGYEDEAARLFSSGVTDAKEYKALWDTISDVTGHGLRGQSVTIGGINPVFSPQAMLGRFRGLLDPIAPELGNLKAGGAPNLIGAGARNVAIKNLLAIGGLTLAVDGAATAAGLNLKWNLLTTPLGKVEVGPSTIDPTAGYGSIARLGAKVVDAIQSGDLQKGKDAATAFVRGQLGPVMDTAVSTFTGQDWQGKDFNFWDRLNENPTKSGSLIRQTVVPIAANSIWDAVKAHGLIGAAIAAPSLGAMSVETNMLQDARDKATARLADQASAAGETMLGPDYASAGPILKNLVDKDQGVIDAKGSASQYQQASDVAHAPVKAEVDRQEALFKQGQNARKLADVYHDAGVANRQAARDLEGQFANTFANFNQKDFDKAVEGYYSPSLQKTVPKGLVGEGDIDFDATAAAQKDYLAGLPADQRQWVTEALQVSEEKKTPLRQEYDRYIDAKKAAGYFKPDITAKERTALDVAHPELDVAAWKFGSVGGKSGGALQTAQAVSMALASADSQHREVKYAGLPTAINESDGTRAAWEQYGERAAKFLGGFQVERDKEKYAQQKFHKAFDDLKDNEKQSVTSFIKTGVLDSSPDLEAYLAYMGQRDTISTDPKAIAALRDLRTKYGREKRPDTNPIRYR